MAGAQIIEEDETGRVCGRYTAALAVIPEPASARRPLAQSVAHALSDMFMPAGFPASVSPDYLEYQLYDSLQAFASSVAGLLASRAVLEGVGVGDASASATHALLLTIAQDAVGRLATILFAWRAGPALAAEAKRFRLLADLLNDAALLLAALAPALPAAGPARALALCASGALRALCGVAAAGAKAALSAHFARAARGVGDLNAKDASQETVVGLLGMLAGSLVVARATAPAASWALLLALLAAHLAANYRAVRAVALRSLTRQRAGLAYAPFRRTGAVPPPRAVAARERIFARGAALLPGAAGAGGARCAIGVPLRRVLPAPRGLWAVFAHERYVLAFARRGGAPSRPSLGIVLKKGARGADELKAWVHAVELAHMLAEAPAPQSELELLAESLRRADARFPRFVAEAARAGWDVDNPALVTRSSCRISTVAPDTEKRD